MTDSNCYEDRINGQIPSQFPQRLVASVGLASCESTYYYIHFFYCRCRFLRNGVVQLEMNRRARYALAQVSAATTKSQ